MSELTYEQLAKVIDDGVSGIEAAATLLQAYEDGWNKGIAAAVKLLESHANKFRSKSVAEAVVRDILRVKVR